MIKKFKLYLQLMRVDKPIGFLLLMWPVVWAFMISTQGNPNIIYLIIFAVGLLPQGQQDVLSMITLIRILILK
jgi:4-hydroxybenzoate polyprenyltransferase